MVNVVNVGAKFGPMLLGVFLNTILYGILIVQVIIYYQNYQRDARWIRYLVLYLFICETINTICDIGIVYEPLVARYGTERANTTLPILFEADSLLTVLVSTPVQLFICWRITVLLKVFGERYKFVALLICFLSLCSFGGGFALSVYNGHVPKYTQLSKSRWAVNLWLISSAVVDVCITTCLVLTLRKCRTGFQKTDNIINRNIRYAIHTGAITSLFAILNCVVFQAIQGTFINFFFDFPLAKLYTNSLLSTFNARALSPQDESEYNVLFGSPDEQLLVGTSLPRFLTTDDGFQIIHQLLEFARIAVIQNSVTFGGPSNSVSELGLSTIPGTAQSSTSR